MKEQAKRLKIEQKLEDVMRDSGKQKRTVQRKIQKIREKKAARIQKEGQRGPNKKKRFTDYTKQHQARIWRGFKEDYHCHF